MCDLSSCAQSVWLYVGEKEEEEAQYARSPKRQSVVFWCAKTEKAHLKSLFSPLFSTAVRSFEPQNWSVFSLFSPIKKLEIPEIPPF